MSTCPQCGARAVAGFPAGVLYECGGAHPNPGAFVEKRRWVYVQRPRDYEIAPCECGNADPDWSEFVHHLWCPACQKDFIPAHNGVFDGPIPINSSMLMGIFFDREILATGTIEVDPESYAFLRNLAEMARSLDEQRRAAFKRGADARLAQILNRLAQIEMDDEDYANLPDPEYVDA